MKKKNQQHIHSGSWLVQEKELREQLEKRVSLDGDALSECNLNLFRGYSRLCAMLALQTLNNDMKGIMAVTSAIDKLYPVVQEMAKSLTGEDVTPDMLECILNTETGEVEPVEA